MKRRQFITLLGGAAAWPLAARAQLPAMPVIGFLGSTPSGPYAAIVAAVRKGLEETGFFEGQNLAIEYRWADNQLDRLPALAADLVSRNVAVIITSGSIPPAMAAKAATSTIPIVFHTGLDPVAAGLVSSLNRPGANITGVTFLTEASTLKRLGLLRDLVPAANVIGLLVNRAEATDAVAKELETVTRSLGLTLHVAYAGSEYELDDAFATLAQRKAVRCSSTPGHSFEPGPNRLWVWQRVTPFQPSIRGATTPWLVASWAMPPASPTPIASKASMREKSSKAKSLVTFQSCSRPSSSSSSTSRLQEHLTSRRRPDYLPSPTR
jgi:putative ABC transport system substrate-binding protein